jgi:hypothetical protein
MGDHYAGIEEYSVDPPSVSTLRGDQAGILQGWGRLEEAMALLEKQQALCLELGNRSGLAYCYWNWGLVAREQRDRNTEREKLTAALDIFTELNMSRERDAVRTKLNKNERTKGRKWLSRC